MASSSSLPPNPTSISPHLQPSPKFKNALKEFTERTGMKLPEFKTVNEGQDHSPAFRSTVIVDGFVFTSQRTFFHLKAAEQDVSKLALDYHIQKIKNEAYTLVTESVTFCKATLNEYASKLNLKLPTYNTVLHGEMIPCFKCTLVFNGTSYTGPLARKKKEAEQLAARVAIFSILGNLDTGMMLFQIVKSKAKLFEAAKATSFQPISDVVVPPAPVENTAHSCEHQQGLNHKENDVTDTPVGNDTNAIEIVAPAADPIVFTQQTEMQTQEPTLEVTRSSNEVQQLGAELSVDNCLIGKKRRKKNNYKANKKARVEAMARALSSNQAPCAAQ